MQTKLQISEIFYSLQGESTFAGLPCIFIRLSGCNLRCNYCDAEYTWESGKDYTLTDILAAIGKYPCKLVEVTGGEPLHQNACHTLLQELLTAGYDVLLETNGSLALSSIPEKVTTIIDVKCPESGSESSFLADNLIEIKRRVKQNPGSCELKFVLSSKNDFLWACNFISKQQIDTLLPLLFSPVKGRISPTDLAAWIMETNLAVRLQLQLHTILWPDKSRGV